MAGLGEWARPALSLAFLGRVDLRDPTYRWGWGCEALSLSYRETLRKRPAAELTARICQKKGKLPGLKRKNGK